MEIEVFNPKEIMREFLIKQYTEIQPKGLMVYQDAFLAYLEALQDTAPEAYRIMMRSIIHDVYEMLKWKQSLKLDGESEKRLLVSLEEVVTLDEMVECVLNENYMAMFMANLYYAQEALLSEKINVKNNIRNVQTNEVLVENDKLRFLEDMGYYANNFILSKEYNKEEYVRLYDSLLRNSLNEDEALENFIDVAYGSIIYHPTHHKKLILDMCLEYYFQKIIAGDFNQNDCTEEYLIYLIKYGKVEHIIDVFMSNRYMMEALTEGYSKYHYFKDDMRKQLNSNESKAEVKKIVNKINKGKNK